jgi:hypothetical protein
LSTTPVRTWGALGRFVVEHQGLVIPLAYVGLVLLGMFHMAIYYARFGVNILLFAQPGDFLLSPLADVSVILVSILPLFIFVIFKKFNRSFENWMQNRRKVARTPEEAARAERLQHTLLVLATGLWIVAFSLTYSRYRAERVEDGKTKRIRVELTNGERLGSARDSTVALIGTTATYAFYYEGRRDTSTGVPRVIIVPVENVARMDQSARRRRR